MELKMMLSEEYKRRLKNIENKINEKERQLTEVETKVAEAKAKHKNEYYHKYFVEKKHNGIRVLIHKKGDEVKIFSDKSEDLTSLFPNVVSQSKSLAIVDLILDCDVVLYNDNKSLDKGMIVKYAKSIRDGKDESDDGMVFYVNDCLYYDKDLTTKPLYERKKVIDFLKLTENIKKSGVVIVDNDKDVVKAIKMFGEMDGSDGAVIKQYDSNYCLSGDSKAWVNCEVNDFGRDKP